MDPRGRWHWAGPQEGNLRAGLGWPDDSLNAEGLQGTECWAGAQASWEGLAEASHPDAARLLSSVKDFTDGDNICVEVCLK